MKLAAEPPLFRASTYVDSVESYKFRRNPYFPTKNSNFARFLQIQKSRSEVSQLAQLVLSLASYLAQLATATQQVPSMPIYVLKIKADLENITQLVATEHNLWKFDISSSSGEVREGVTVSTADVIPLEGSFIHTDHGIIAYFILTVNGIIQVRKGKQIS